MNVLRVWFGRLLGLAVFASACLAWAGAANAQVVALGASNVSGWGVSSEAAWPTVLQKMLRERGRDVTVTNAGIAGDGTRQVLSRIDAAIPAGTRVVILDTGGVIRNNYRLGVDAKIGPGELAEIIDRLKAKGVKVITMWKEGDQIGPPQRQADGVHLSEAGHEAQARHLLPQVLSALGGSARVSAR
jgi:acyl-CoA thioesterase I